MCLWCVWLGTFTDLFSQMALMAVRESINQARKLAEDGSL